MWRPFACLFCVTACAPTPDPATAPRGGGPDGTAPTIPAAPEQADDDEVFALYERFVEATTNPSPFSNNVENSETYALKRLVHRPGEAVYDEQLCATWGNVVFDSTWSFVADFPERRGILERPVTDLDDQFSAGPYADLLGTDVESGPLPEDADDPGVIDTDADGNPGVTVFVDHPNPLVRGRVYIAQRSVTTLAGEWVDDDVATGPFDVDTESNTLGASNPILAGEGAAGDPRPDESFFVVMRIDPALDCAAIVDEADAWGLTQRP